MQKTQGRVPKQCWHLRKVGLPEIISVHASDLWVICKCRKVADSKAYWLRTTLLKMKCVVPVYVEILWLTIFMLENCSIYCERQMSFSLLVAAFDCRGLATCESKELSFYPLLSWHFPANFSVSTWCSVLVEFRDWMLFVRFLLFYFVFFLTYPLPSWCESILTSDHSSPLPYWTPVFLRNMGGLFSYHSINLEVAGVCSGRFAGSLDVT